jgi:hypothetical protein
MISASLCRAVPGATSVKRKGAMAGAYMMERAI